jgi:hypothetical protein
VINLHLGGINMDKKEVENLVEQLFLSDTKIAYAALKALMSESEQSKKVYEQFDTFTKMINDENSYIRTRGLLLIAKNVKWDKENKFNKIVKKFLEHVEDEKPITSRQVIQSLKDVIQYKKELIPIIKDKLCKINYEKVPDTMKGLIFKDADGILKMIEKTIKE